MPRTMELPKEVQTQAARPKPATTLLVTHPACVGHHISHHPEQPKRVVAIERAVVSAFGSSLAHDAAPRPVTVEELELFHAPTHVARILALCARAEKDAATPAFDPRRGGKKRRAIISIDDDTAVMAGSRAAALASAGGALRCVDAVLGAEGYANAFACVRPPGHHATPDAAMGFCLFNNVGVAALYARATYGARRVAVVDVDVHHGNGTEAYFRRDADLFYSSFHQGGGGFYPGTGLTKGARTVDAGVGARIAGETGVAGNVVNCPLPGGSGARGVRRALEDRILPALRAFKPALVLISLGLDALDADPIGGLRLAPDDYGWITEAVASAAPAAKLVSVLEGGYDLPMISRAAVCHVRALLGLAGGGAAAAAPPPPSPSVSSGESWGSGQEYGADDDDDDEEQEQEDGAEEDAPMPALETLNLDEEEAASPPPPPPARGPIANAFKNLKDQLSNKPPGA